jgi:hypothetical protein
MPLRKVRTRLSAGMESECDVFSGVEAGLVYINTNAMAQPVKLIDKHQKVRLSLYYYGVVIIFLSLLSRNWESDLWSETSWRGAWGVARVRRDQRASPYYCANGFCLQLARWASGHVPAHTSER